MRMDIESKRLGKQVSFRITQEHLEAAEAIAKREERKVADVVRRLFLKGLSLEGKKR